jgi:hypothetical protein
MTTTPAESVHEGDGWLLDSPRRAAPDFTVAHMTHNDETGTPSQSVLRLPGGDAAQERESLYQTIREQASQLDRLTSQAESLLHRQRELRTMLIEAHEQLIRRDSEVEQIRARHHAELERTTAEVTARLHGEILQRDAELLRRDAATDELRTWALGQIDDLKAQLERDRRQLNSFRSSRLWRTRQLMKRLLRV